MKTLALFVLLVMTSFGLKAQLISGELVQERRKLISNTDFVVEGRMEGTAKYELAVDRTGNVTSATLVDSEIKSTPLQIKFKNYAKTLKFEPGTHYPKFHHVVILLTMKRPSEK